MSTTTALVGLFSAVLGALLGGVLSLWEDGRRWRRDDRQRWHERRLDAYATTLDCLTRVFAVFNASVEAARPRLQPPWAPRRLHRRMQSAEPVLQEAQRALFIVRLVGGSQCVAATEGCLQVICELTDELGRWSRASPTDLFSDHLRELSAARNELVDAARRELDVRNE